MSLAAIVSSVISPIDKPLYGASRQLFSPERRLQDTLLTVQSLLALGIADIRIADNSGPRWRAQWEEALQPARVSVHSVHDYANKGISELYLLLAALAEMPVNGPLLKLSGRYSLATRLDQFLGEDDLVVRKGADLNRRGVVTVAYVVKDRATFERLLRDTLRESFGYPCRIVGLRSLGRILRNSIRPAKDSYPYDDPPESIENALGRVIDRKHFKVRFVDCLGVSGFSAQDGCLKLH